MLTLFYSAPTICWLVILVGFLALEGMTTALVCLWFAVGALAALLLSLVTINLWAQAFTFALVSLVALLLMRPFVSKFMHPKGTTPTNADRLIGRTAIVTETIDELEGTGQVKVAGLEWSARTPDGSTIQKGHRVTIQAIQGVKLTVLPVTNEVV